MTDIGNRMVVAMRALLLMGVASAHAQVSLVTTRSGLAGTDFIDWGTLGPSGTVVASNPFTFLSNGGVTVNVSEPTGHFQRLDQGNGWSGNFNPDETLLYTFSGTGPITVDFSESLTAFGANIQSHDLGGFIAQLDFFDASNTLVGTVSEAGTSTQSGDGSAIFIGGVSNGSATNFTSVRISLNNPLEPFAINQADFTAAIPEPPTLALLGLATAGACGYRWQRQRKPRQKT